MPYGFGQLGKQATTSRAETQEVANYEAHYATVNVSETIAAVLLFAFFATALLDVYAVIHVF